MSLVTLDMIEDYMGRELSGDEQLAASVVFIPGVEADLRSRLGRPLAIQPYDSTFHGDGTSFLTLESPVVSVMSVSLNGVALASSSWVAVGWGIRFAQPIYPSDAVRVVYTAGLSDTDTAALRHIVLARITRELLVRADDAWGADNINVEGYVASYTPDGWTSHELASLGLYRRRSMRAGADPPVDSLTYWPP